MGPSPAIPNAKPSIATGNCAKDLGGGDGGCSTISFTVARLFKDCRELLLGKGGLPNGYDLLAILSLLSLVRRMVDNPRSSLCRDAVQVLVL
jgi:hypothetical protein